MRLRYSSNTSNREIGSFYAIIPVSGINCYPTYLKAKTIEPPAFSLCEATVCYHLRHATKNLKEAEPVSIVETKQTDAHRQGLSTAHRRGADHRRDLGTDHRHHLRTRLAGGYG